jgi:DNA topoisomerase-1
MVEAGIGRYGPYVKHGSLYANLPEVDEVFTIGMNRAVEVLAQKAAGRAGRGQRAPAAALKELGPHPEKGGAIQVLDGRYGPYVKWEKVNATLPKGTDPAAVTLEMAVGLIDAKGGKSGKGKTGAKKATAKAPATKAAGKKAAAKKPAAKKKSA